MPATRFIIIPLITALLWWLFYRLGRKLALRRIYQRRVALARNMAQHLSGSLLSNEALAKNITDPAVLASVRPLIEVHLETFLSVKLQEKLPVIAMFASPEMLGKIKEGMLEEIDLLLPEVIQKYVGGITAGESLSTAVADKAQALSSQAMVRLITQGIGVNTVGLDLYAILLGLLNGLVFLLFFRVIIHAP
jgi:hypothetical protein